LLAGAIKGDVEGGLGQSVTRIPERSATALPTVQGIFAMFEAVLGASASDGRAWRHRSV